MEVDYDYDLFVIGGGSGGMASSKEAAKYGAKVAVADYVVPSPQGTTWGLGGTCVNVGCVPKKMMHIAAQLGEKLEDLENVGFPVENVKQKIDWPKMQDVVAKRIQRINGFYTKSLDDNKVKYYNKLARFKDANVLELYVPGDDSQTETVKAKQIIICTGGRPTLPYKEIDGVEKLVITSDDIFWRKTNPGKTCVVGGGYIALECGGFITSFGNEVTMIVRSTLLSAFDSDMSKKIGAYMETHNRINFQYQCIVKEIKEVEGGRKLVVWENSQTFERTSDTFDTVLYAIGRTANVASLQLEKAGVEVNPTNRKIKIDKEDRSTQKNIYALGDCADGIPELTPVAIRQGRLLARRLYNNETELFDHDIVPTTVFTPLEYGCIGLSEEAAIKKFGKDNVEVYHTHFKPLEWNFVEKRDYNTCYLKLVVNSEDKERVVGFHYLGPQAGEITQGYAVAMANGATLHDFQRTVGIHPTCSEEVVSVETNKKDGDGLKTGC